MAEQIICSRCEQRGSKAKNRSICAGCQKVEQQTRQQRYRKACRTPSENDAKHVLEVRRGYKDEWAGARSNELLQTWRLR